MTFVDTSAIYALLDRSDANHPRAAADWMELIKSRSPLLTTNYVVIEVCALCQHRLGMEAVRALHDNLFPLIQVHYVDEAVHALGMAALLAASRRKLSLVDCTSFQVMRQFGIRHAFAFDRHFEEEGFARPAQ